MKHPLAYLSAVLALFVLPIGVSADGVPNIAHYLAGTWNGSGHQQGTGSDWTIRLNVIVGDDDASFKISYPSLKCGGYWTLQREFERSATFIEHITFGTDTCVDGGTITIALGGSNNLAYQWMSGDDSASGQLTREQQGGWQPD